MHIGLIEMTRQRRLHQNAMDLQVGIELRDEFQQILFRSGLRQEVCARSDGETRAHPLLHAHVNLRSWIIADPNESQAWLHTALLQKRNALGGLGVNLFGTRGSGSFANTTGFVIRKSSVLNGGPIVVSAFRGLVKKVLLSRLEERAPVGVVVEGRAVTAATFREELDLSRVDELSAGRSDYRFAQADDAGRAIVARLGELVREALE